jgi:hypothetical protein
VVRGVAGGVAAAFGGKTRTLGNTVGKKPVSVAVQSGYHQTVRKGIRLGRYRHLGAFSPSGSTAILKSHIIVESETE